MKRIFAGLIVVVLLLSCLYVSGGAAEDGYTITNPYEAVDWTSWQAYRASMHTHSMVSDGENNFDEMVEWHYNKGYDILAMTDHGVVDRGWVDVNTFTLLQYGAQLKRGAFGPINGLTRERWEEISTGSDRNGQKMLRVPFGIEQNPTSLNNAHVNSWFADWGDRFLGGTSDWETPVRGVDKAGGLSVINHPSYYTKEYEKPIEDAYEGTSVYYVYKVQRLLEKYPSLIGIDINSRRDGDTKTDRILWDKLLKNLAPTGRNVLGIATSDAHYFDIADCAWIWSIMPENTEENLRESLETGAFFAASHFIKNELELAILSEETGRDLGTQWEADYTQEEPMITNIDVDEANGRISLTAKNAETVRWISDGKVIAVGDSINLSDCEDLGAYVRAEVWGPGGILYTQAFLLQYDGMPKGNSVPMWFVDFGGLLATFRRIMLMFYPF